LGLVVFKRCPITSAKIAASGAALQALPKKNMGNTVDIVLLR
jgi:hypothetical protein